MAGANGSGPRGALGWFDPVGRSHTLPAMMEALPKYKWGRRGWMSSLAPSRTP